jgi:hypothetical protein
MLSLILANRIVSDNRSKQKTPLIAIAAAVALLPVINSRRIFVPAPSETA